VSDSGRVIPVEICGQRYPIRTTLDPEYVSQLANYVDEKMRAAGEAAPTGDPQRLFRARETTRARDGEVAERAGELERLVDRVLLA
jgi:hypothetical protein